MNKNNWKEKLKKITSSEPSAGREKLLARKAKPWLRVYSSEIAKRVLAAIEDNDGLNQAKLAETLNVSPQQVSKIVKGKENLTLESIYKLSKALKVELIRFPEYKYSVPIHHTNDSFPVTLLSDGNVNLIKMNEMMLESSTSILVSIHQITTLSQAQVQIEKSNKYHQLKISPNG